MFLDTSGLICFLDQSEYRHDDAVQFLSAAPFRVTHNYVIAEFVALAEARRLPRASALSLVRELRPTYATELLYVDEHLHHDAIILLEQRLDKAWSLCDAVSFLVMQQFGTREALTTDHHFEQAGFVRLLPS